MITSAINATMKMSLAAANAVPATPPKPSTPAIRAIIRIGCAGAQNAIDLAHALGQAEVRVAILSAMETVTAVRPCRPMRRQFAFRHRPP